MKPNLKFMLGFLIMLGAFVGMMEGVSAGECGNLPNITSLTLGCNVSTNTLWEGLILNFSGDVSLNRSSSNLTINGSSYITFNSTNQITNVIGAVFGYIYAHYKSERRRS